MRFSARRHAKRRLTRSDRVSANFPCKKSPSASRSCRPKSRASRRHEEPNKRLSTPLLNFLNSTSHADGEEARGTGHGRLTQLQSAWPMLQDIERGRSIRWTILAVSARIAPVSREDFPPGDSFLWQISLADEKPKSRQFKRSPLVCLSLARMDCRKRASNCTSFRSTKSGGVW
jgi:hypothetical protein